MNSIILNGVSSETISGLLIQRLPPITKPPKRVEIATVDGRAGDIITDLGFAAYDRTVTIGLHGSFDIDAVIAFFNSSGVAVFSNEPDRVYSFAVVNQIDFARLIRFRTADVVFHVQPYKASESEGAILVPSLFPAPTSRTVTVTNAGNVPSAPQITVTNCANPITLSVNGQPLLAIALSSSVRTITIDAAAMEAYNDNGLKNRLVTGDFSKFLLQPGANTITIDAGSEPLTGDFIISNYSRWV